jgi:hypothetical protein
LTLECDLATQPLGARLGHQPLDVLGPLLDGGAHLVPVLMVVVNSTRTTAAGVIQQQVTNVLLDFQFRHFGFDDVAATAAVDLEVLAVALANTAPRRRGARC